MSSAAGMREFSNAARSYRVLMGARSRIGRRRFNIGNSRSWLSAVCKWTLFIFPIGSIGVVLFLAFYEAFDASASAYDAESVLASVLALIVIAGFVCCLTTALQSFYLSQDLPFLISLPLPLSAIYGGKLLDAMVGTLPTGFVMVLLVTAFGVAQGGGALYFGVALAFLVLTSVASTSISVLFVAVVTRYVPPKRSGFILVPGALILMLGAFSCWSLLLPDANVQLGQRPTLDVGTAGDLVALTPAGWAAHALASAATYNLGAVAVSGFAFVSAVALCSFYSYRVFAGTFTIGYAKVRGLQSARPRRPIASASSRAISWLPQDLGGIVLKEWLVMFRDLRRLSGAIWPVGMVAVYTIVLSHQQRNSPGGDLHVWMQNAPLALLPWGASLGISIYSFGTEGRNWELVRAAPVRPRRIFLAKAIAAFIPVFAAAEAATLIVTMSRHSSAHQLLGMVAIVAWAAAGYVLIDCAVSALSPVFDADHVQRSTSFTGRIVDIFAGAAFGIFSAIAIGRIVLFTIDPPTSLNGALAWHVAGVAILGWPLVVVSACIAIGVVAVTVAAGIESVARLIRDGV